MTPLHVRVDNGFKIRLAGLTVRTRIVAFFAVLIAAISVFILIVFPAAIERQARGTLERQAQSISRVVAHSVASGVVFQDRAAIRSSLEAALQNEAVLLIEVQSIEDSVGVTVWADGASAMSNDVLTHQAWGDSVSVLSYDAPVLFSGTTIGAVHVDLSQAQVLADVREARLLVALISLVVFLVSMAAARMMGRRIVAPLADVAATAERIADGDLDSRAEAPADDEVGQLARSFNRMVDRLQASQEHLHQAQKMESIGQLAGGIAHDFNNLLTTILGNAEFLMMDLPPDHKGRDDVREIQAAGERAARLTGQLLAFSRRQVTNPQTLNLNSVLLGVEKMLTRVIGESFEIDVDIEPDLMNIQADPGHLEQIMVNLAVNARDAMDGGGTLRVRTDNAVLQRARQGRRGPPIPAGRYVLLTVSDDGTGMDNDTLDRIFEPFFTRKGPGEGTGLGLSTVHGLIQQARGFIQVESRVGFGTTFSLYFPETEGVPEVTLSETLASALPTGTETILIAEDQKDVRKLTRKALERLGYRVLTAHDGEAALNIARTPTETIDLLLTDVVMPGMSGPVLAEAMASMSPGTPVIYMSGYTDDQLQNHGVLDEGIVLIEKPFNTADLATTVRDVLNGVHSSTQLVQAL